MRTSGLRAIVTAAGLFALLWLAVPGQAAAPTVPPATAPSPVPAHSPGLSPAQPAAPTVPQPAQPDTCTECHRSLGGRLAAPTLHIADDIHVRRGFSCSACHGGDPRAPGMEAMDPKKGFVGKPTPQQIPGLCGACHSKPEFMRRFNPSIRTDEVAEYLTSVHGQRLVKGDPRVATCTSCHGVHPILAISDSKSPVFRSNVPATCARCHADARYMAPYGIKTDQYADYRASVHGEALLQRGSKQAPACNDCHGNHGAVPPGVSSIANVCAQCHSSQRDLFARSPHRAAFAAAGLPQCTVCHSNHRIIRPSDEMVGAAAPAVCANCHTPDTAGGRTARTIRGSLEDLKGSISNASTVVAAAENAGMDMTDARLPLSDAQTQLILARNLVHSLSLREVQTAVTEGAGLSEKAADLGRAALAEIAFRRRGLGAALAALLILGLGLYFKIRTLPGPSREP